MIGAEAESSSSVVLAADVWWPGVDWGWGWGWGWATAVAFVFILAWHYAGRFFFIFLFSRLGGSNANLTIPTAHNPQLRVSEIVSEDDLKFLIDNLEENPDETEKWELVTERRNSTVYYTAKCCKPKSDGRLTTQSVKSRNCELKLYLQDGPLKYLSVTLFENCSRELLGNFYMDNDYRKLWDNMLTVFEQLEVDRSNGTEIGRMIKKFPLLTAREYVLAWRLWEGSDASLYCFTKECDHPMAPCQRKFVRVRYFRSGWRIRQVPGQNASEIRMFHQEDAGLNVEMAKLAFSKGIWSYVCKMDNALRKYSIMSHPRRGSAVNALSLIQKVPPGLDTKNRVDGVQTFSTDSLHHGRQSSEEAEKSKKLLRRPSKKVLANGVIFLGGILYLTRGNPAVGAKVAMAYILTKLSKRGRSSSCQSLQQQ